MIDSTLKNACILIIDDKQENIDILEGLLIRQKYTNLKSITDPRMVVDVFKGLNPDLLLLDLMMPHLNGFQVMEQLEPLIPDNDYLPILILTADVNPESKLKALSGGASDFLTKPFDLVEVDLRIKNLLKKRFLHQQLNNQNLLLDAMVKERTAELENTIAELKIAIYKAEASDRLKTAFLNNISHEIRTPLNGILGFANFVIQPDITKENKEEFLDILNQSGERLINTVTDFMDISLIVSGNLVARPNPVDVFNLLTTIYHGFRGHCTKKNLEFNIQVPHNPEKVFIKTDEEMLQKCISHLVGNAIKFTSKGSITLGLEINEDGVSIFVKDTGIGISEGAKAGIFDSFMQENGTNTRGYEGSGLGLAITKGMMDLLGGNIQLESAKNLGTTVILTLPNKIITTPKIQKSTTLNFMKNKIPYILIVEDDHYSYTYLDIILNKDNKILRAVNGKEAVELCRINPGITHILMDIKLPEMDGYEATKQIRQFNNDVVIIAQTAYGLSGDREKAIAAGCNDYISKPIKKDELVKLIQKYSQ
ncbi:MAG: PAS/PAC sensor hybrid histidine [Prolixibacteraceae bacterium]|nr:MAG: PAS/PAC sensor hybrid histidine [Prolixibacteraceae bacterium]